MNARHNLRWLLALTALPAWLFSACGPAASESAELARAEAAAPGSDASPADPARSGDPADPEAAAGMADPGSEGQPAEDPAELAMPEQSAPTDVPADSSPASLGPDQYPAGINPLTGLPVSDPSVLQDCPLLVAVSNFPPSSRRSLSGLSVASQVWETFIGEGMTRYLAVFYGDYAEQLNGILANPLVEGSNFAIGPVRSGRVAFEDIKMLFPGATLVTAGASPEVAEQLTGVQTAYGSDPENISSAGLEASDLGGLPCRHGKPPSLAGLAFDAALPDGGSSAESLQVIYNTFNQVGWEYDAAQGAYLRSQDKADGSGALYPTLENLTGEQLAFENVLVLFADHHFVKPTIIEINLMFVEEHRGLLFRDGLVFPVTWSTLRGQLRLTDGQGNPLPLKPGQTFLEVVSYQTTWNPDSHIIRYHNP
jgi:hypothetical protein